MSIYSLESLLNIMYIMLFTFGYIYNNYVLCFTLTTFRLLLLLLHLLLLLLHLIHLLYLLHFLLLLHLPHLLPLLPLLPFPPLLPLLNLVQIWNHLLRAFIQVLLFSIFATFHTKFIRKRHNKNNYLWRTISRVLNFSLNFLFFSDLIIKKDAEK